MPTRRRALGALAATALLATASGGCGALPVSAQIHGIRVVAAENVWGSIARAIGGADATVTSIVQSPAQDPHAYEPTAADARAVAGAQLVIVNGIGYDPWAPRLLAADPADGRDVLSVGALLGLHAGENPHRWYDPADVRRVAAAIAARMSRIDPHHAGGFDRRLRAFTGAGLAGYQALITRIRRRYAGTPIGASESIFALQAPALGLRLLTPPGLLRAVSEGTELSARDTSTAEAQITARRIRVWVVNAQNLTPEVQRLSGLARAAGLPVVAVTETLSPPTASFAQWQTRQLATLAAALHRATAR
ncbi:MAG TPA: zinc ABC transporter substrate-binding protein [Solirubrobacteraceae bacterium]|nr:zinc ABC transporter substrate-binding protein [Solirubrobacteraceae bacterium]